MTPRLGLLIASLLLGEPSAADLTRQGEQAIENGKLTEAVELLQKALDADGGSAAAHYQLAAALARAREKGLTCELNAYLGDILEHLQNSVRLDPKRLAQVKADPRFASIRQTIGFLTIIGKGPDREEQVPALLTQIGWLGPSPGAYGNRSGISFDAQGRFSFWRLNVGEAITREVYAGSYMLKGRRLHLTFEHPLDGKLTRDGTLARDGTLRIGDLDTFNDTPDDCSA